MPNSLVPTLIVSIGVLEPKKASFKSLSLTIDGLVTFQPNTLVQCTWYNISGGNLSIATTAATSTTTATTAATTGVSGGNTTVAAATTTAYLPTTTTLALVNPSYPSNVTTMQLPGPGNTLLFPGPCHRLDMTLTSFKSQLTGRGFSIATFTLATEVAGPTMTGNGEMIVVCFEVGGDLFHVNI